MHTPPGGIACRGGLAAIICHAGESPDLGKGTLACSYPAGAAAFPYRSHTTGATGPAQPWNKKRLGGRIWTSCSGGSSGSAAGRAAWRYGGMECIAATYGDIGTAAK